MRTTLATALLAAALLAGCGDNNRDWPSTVPSGEALRYERSGGVAASDIKLVIRTDGGAVLVTGIPGDRNRTRFRLDDRLVEKLRQLAEDADLPALADQPPEPVTCADCYSYRVGYGGVVVERVEIAVPDSLDELLAGLQDVVDEHGAGG